MKRYVISIRKSGLGDRLISLAAAWLFARNTGRTLVVDWRFGAYSDGSDTNVFGSCFRVPAELAGVPVVVADDSIGGCEFPRPRYPSVWNDDDLIRVPTRRPRETVLSDRDEAVALILSRADIDAPTVVFDGCVDDGVVLISEYRELLGALEPLPAIQQARELFRDRFLSGGCSVGLHVRHGNGGDIMDHTCYWGSFPGAIGRCVRAVETAQKQSGGNARVFLCTDSIEVQETLKRRIPGVICRPKSLDPVGAGEFHLSPRSSRTLADALVDMMLLSDCDLLIRYPPGSFFSLYAAVMKSPHDPPPRAISDLTAPSDSNDSLSPAIV